MKKLIEWILNNYETYRLNESDLSISILENPTDSDYATVAIIQGATLNMVDKYKYVSSKGTYLRIPTGKKRHKRLYI